MKSDLKYKKLKIFLDKFNEAYLICNDVREIKKIYEQELNSKLDLLLKKQKCTIEEFLILIIGVNFWTELLETRKLRLKKYQIQQRNKWVNKISKDDLSKTLTKIYHDFFEALKTLQKSSLKPKINHSLKLDQLLEAATANKIYINDQILTRLKMAHFGIDWKVAEKGLPPGRIFNARQAANFLSKHLGEDFSTKNVLEECLANNFYTYIDFSKYYDPSKDIHFLFRSIAEITSSITNGDVFTAYPYRYEGLLRLLTDYDNYDFNDFTNSQTVKYLCHGGTIQIGTTHRFLTIQISLSDYILGHSPIIQVKEGEQLNEIKIKNLRFREEELIEFITQYKKREIPSSSLFSGPSTNFQLLSRPAIKKNYTKFTQHAWDKHFLREKDNGLINAKIPGKTKQQDRYRQDLFHHWLKERGHYSMHELNKIPVEQKIDPHSSSWQP